MALNPGFVRLVVILIRIAAIPLFLNAAVFMFFYNPLNEAYYSTLVGWRYAAWLASNGLTAVFPFLGWYGVFRVTRSWMRRATQQKEVTQQDRQKDVTAQR
jgi:hypothetical protein